jgi:hypothetical protein
MSSKSFLPWTVSRTMSQPLCGVCPVCRAAHGVALFRVAAASELWPASCQRCGARFHHATVRASLIGEGIGLAAAATVGALSGGALLSLGMALVALAILLALKLRLPLVSAEGAFPGGSDGPPRT